MSKKFTLNKQGADKLKDGFQQRDAETAKANPNYADAEASFIEAEAAFVNAENAGEEDNDPKDIAKSIANNLGLTYKHLGSLSLLQSQSIPDKTEQKAKLNEALAYFAKPAAAVLTGGDKEQIQQNTAITHHKLGQVLKSEAHAKAGDVDAASALYAVAIQEFTEAQKLDSESWKIAYDIALCLEAKGDDAVAMFKKTIELATKDVKVSEEKTAVILNAYCHIYDSKNDDADNLQNAFAYLSTLTPAQLAKIGKDDADKICIKLASLKVLEDAKWDDIDTTFKALGDGTSIAAKLLEEGLKQNTSGDTEELKGADGKAEAKLCWENAMKIFVGVKNSSDADAQATAESYIDVLTGNHEDIFGADT